MTCTSNAENNAAALELAEKVLRLAVKQNPRSLRATTDLAASLMKAASCVTLDPCSPHTAKTDLVCLARYRQVECAIIYFKAALKIQPDYCYAKASIKSLEEWLKIDKEYNGYDRMMFVQYFQWIPLSRAQLEKRHRS